MGDGLGLLTAVYRDGRVHIGGKSYPAGTFAVHLLNQYYKDDTAARIAVFRQSNWNVQEQLCAGYLNETDFIKAEREILTILQTLPKLKPFSSLNIAAERQRIAELFTESNAAALSDYLRRRAVVTKMDEGSVGLGVFPPEYDKALFKNAETMCATVLSTLRFYDAIPEEMRKAFELLKRFVSRVDEANRFDERHLLPIATEVDLFAVVQFRCRAVGAVFLPPCALHQETLLANLALPRIVSVVQSLKEIRQYKAVIALKGHSSGSNENATVPPFRQRNIFCAQR